MAHQLVRIRVQSCGNGDECPALDRRPGGGIEVTGTRVDRPGLPDHEAVVLVPDTLILDAAALVVPNLGAYIAERHQTDLLRVQTLDCYQVGSDGDDVNRYLRGDAEPMAPGKHEWLAKLRSYATDGGYLGAVEASADAGAAYAALAEIAWGLATPFLEWWGAHAEFHRSSWAA